MLSLFNIFIYMLQHILQFLEFTAAEAVTSIVFIKRNSLNILY